MGKTNSFAGLILLAGTAKEFENAFVIVFCNATAVVLHLDPNHVSPFGRGSDSKGQGPIRMFIFDSIIEKVTKDLFDRQAVRVKARSLDFKLDAAVAFADLVIDAVGDGLEHRLQLDDLGLQLASAIARDLQDGVDQAVHLLRR